MKKRVLIDLRVTCDAPHVGRYCRTLEQKASAFEDWARDFHEFIRDHRSQDPITLDVERVYEDQCEHCGYAWELDGAGCPVCCEKAIEEWEAQKESAT